MAFRWIYGDERVARLSAAGFSTQLGREVTAPTRDIWAAGGDAFRDWPERVFALVNSGIEHELGIADAEIVPVVHVDESSMHYVLLVDGKLYDHGDEWLVPIADVDTFVADTLVRAWETERFSDDRLNAWADSLGHPDAVARFRARIG